MSAAGAQVRILCDCGATVTVSFAAGNPAPGRVVCASCGVARDLHPAGAAPGLRLWRCLACGHPELFTQKDFPRALGISIVVVAAVLAPFTHYLSLAAAASIDAALYLSIRDVVICYGCGSGHRGFAREPKHPRFDREIDERLRYGRKAVMGRPMREGGTAGAPEPEH